MTKRHISLLVALAVGSGLYAQMTREQYIAKFQDIAVREMNRSGIPASITLGQGILESDGGNSDLATKANNHFGIKCGDAWTGKSYKKKDDDRNAIGMKVKSCFRSYNNAEQSYVDHSDFLIDPAKAYRYGPLFELDPTDYKGWAKGLKKAGYATSNTYDKKLIDIIENYKLYKYDTGGGAIAGKPEEFTWGAKPNSVSPVEDAGTTVAGAAAGAGAIQYNNAVKYVIAEPGEQVASIAARTEKPVKTLMKYNENLTSGDQTLTAGTVVYLQPKRGSYRGKETYHTVENGETMFDISHHYGTSLSKLYKRNMMVEGQEPAPGAQIKLKGGPVSMPPATTGGGAVAPDSPYQSPQPGNSSSPNRPASESDESISESDLQGEGGEKRKFFFGSKNKKKNDDTVSEKGVDQYIPPPAGASQAAVREEGIYHVVAEGETLWKISQLYNTSIDQIKKLNNSTSNAVRPGMRIRVQ